MKILFFEDDIDISFIVVHNLKKLGHEVIAILNAADLSTNNSLIKNGQFDFILSDFHMPEIPFELVLSIAEIQNKPLLVQTSNCTKVYKFQMDKAVHRSLLEKRINEVLTYHQQGAHLEQANTAKN